MISKTFINNKNKYKKNIISMKKKNMKWFVVTNIKSHIYVKLDYLYTPIKN